MSFKLMSMNRRSKVWLDVYKRQHYYNVSLGVEVLRQEAIERNCDIAMYGHTHRPFLEVGKDVTILNPGSLSYPRQEGRKPSYMVMEMDEDGTARYQTYYLDRE